MAFVSLTLRSMISRCHSSAAAAFSCLPAFSFSRCGVVQKMPRTIRRFCARSRGEKQAAGRGKVGTHGRTEILLPNRPTPAACDHILPRESDECFKSRTDTPNAQNQARCPTRGWPAPARRRCGKIARKAAKVRRDKKRREEEESS